MGSWGKTDTSSNAVNYVARQLKASAGNANVTGNSTGPLYANVTSGSFVPGQVIGLFGVTTGEMNNANGGGVIQGFVVNPGSGYAANAVLTIQNGNTAAANASANATGRATINMTNFGNLYFVSETGTTYALPTLAVAAPTAQTFNANSLVNANGQIAIGSTIFQNNDIVTYLVAAGNTAIANLVTNTAYNVVGANSSGLYLSATQNGSPIVLAKGFTETGHSLTGQTATGTLSLNLSGQGNLNLTQSFFGSGYAANAVVTVNTSVSGGYNAVGATGNAHANSTGYIDVINITANGSLFLRDPIANVAAPAAKTFNANTGVVNNSLAVTGLNNGDFVQYKVAAGNTVLVGLTANSFYYIGFANATTVSLVNTPTQANAIVITASVTSETGHSLTGQTATAKVIVGGKMKKVQGVAHAGWNLRTVGTGGRAGRIMSECLVAMGTITTSVNNAVNPTS